MEIFNSIWTALSTPNEGLINILLIPASIIETIILMYLFLTITNLNSTKAQKILYVIFICSISELTSLFFPNPFNNFINYFTMIIFAYIIFKNPFLKTTFSVVLSIIISNLASILILNPYLKIFNIEANQLNLIPIYRYSYMFIIFFLNIAIILTLKSKKLKLQFLENIDKKSRNIILLNLFIGIVTIIFQSITLFYYVDKLPITITFFSFVSLFLYFGISIYSLTRIFKLILTTRDKSLIDNLNNFIYFPHYFTYFT